MNTHIPPSLEHRFTQPESWHWGSFTRKNRKIRFGFAYPATKAPDAIVIYLPGLGDFAEKYFETARDCLTQDLAFATLDWMGQGASGRFLKNPQKRHSEGFQEDIDDLHTFITEHILPQAPHIPLILLAHSMGGNIGLHYLAQHPKIFTCAALSAPMIKIKALRLLPKPLLLSLSAALNTCAGRSYVFLGTNWSRGTRPETGPLALSSDPVRRTLHNNWFDARPDLRVGAVTFGWVYHAVRACLALETALQTIKTPCLFGVAGEDHLVDNAAITYAAHILGHADLISFPTARHEILMEKDEIRAIFMKNFFTLIKDTCAKT